MSRIILASAFLALMFASLAAAQTGAQSNGGPVRTVASAHSGEDEPWPAAADSNATVNNLPRYDSRPSHQFESTFDDATAVPVISEPGDGVPPSSVQSLSTALDDVRVGYERGFIIASGLDPETDVNEAPFLLRLSGLGQLRETLFDSRGDTLDLNQFQLIRGRLIFSGNAFTPDFRYFVQLDGRSSAGNEFRMLDYFMEFDLGKNWLDLEENKLIFKTGRYKIPFSFARFMSAREFQFSDRSVSSMFFDLNRSMAWGLGGQAQFLGMPIDWETSLFNGFVTGGAETGSSGSLDNNLAYSARVSAFPTGDWGTGTLADFDWHETLATRIGAGYGSTTISREGLTEFNIIRVVDSGDRLGSLLPAAVDEYNVNTFCIDASAKYRGWSVTSEYYFRNISGFQGATLPDLYDHGFWLQTGKFVVPSKVELLARWSRVVGTSGTLGSSRQSADEVAGGLAWYFRQQNAKLTFDATWLNGAPISSSALNITPGAMGWLLRTQIQFAF